MVGWVSGTLKNLTTEERFFRQVQKHSDGCWEWLGGKDRDGYPRMRSEVDGVLYKKAHRFSVAYFRGEHPVAGQNVCHTCDNPSCVNPDHLYVGSIAENQAEKWAKGRGKVSYGEQHYSTDLTEDDVRFIRASQERQEDLAKRFGVTQTTISDIRRRKSWRHVR